MNREQRRAQKGEAREITSATIGGREIPADRLICPRCNTLDLNMSIDTSDPVEWVGKCGHGHSWKFNVVDCEVASDGDES